MYALESLLRSSNGLGLLDSASCLCWTCCSRFFWLKGAIFSGCLSGRDGKACTDFSGIEHIIQSLTQSELECQRQGQQEAYSGPSDAAVRDGSSTCVTVVKLIR
ncbi:hypothetical protein Y1Q_0015481 [Alligator mississippiensis]|uniref:Uncharacterized protein n=1 Tax=Alligator mississippiensis TaxID=8496 RepID=A0A151MV89_ALLMI|nr:hypothetical protein Y1Q_0015481 [Alligator mississippiensis]